MLSRGLYDAHSSVPRKKCLAPVGQDSFYSARLTFSKRELPFSYKVPLHGRRGLGCMFEA